MEPSAEIRVVVSDASLDLAAAGIDVGLRYGTGEWPGTRAVHLFDVKAPMLFLQGTRDDLADLTLLEPIIKKLGKRATLHIIDEGNHSFKVPKRTGKTEEDVMQELVDTIAQWTDALP